MGWKKNSPEMIRRFEELVAVGGAERKIMFGCPVYELHGQRYAMLHEDRVVLRLSPEHAAQLIAKGGRTWEPMKGRARKDRVVVPEAIAKNARSLNMWVHRSSTRAVRVIRCVYGERKGAERAETERHRDDVDA